MSMETPGSCCDPGRSGVAVGSCPVLDQVGLWAGGPALVVSQADDSHITL